MTELVLKWLPPGRVDDATRDRGAAGPELAADDASRSRRLAIRFRSDPCRRDAADATLKGPTATASGSGFRSVNVALRQKLELYANFRPARSLPGIKSRYEDVDLIVIRENTEGLYSGLEHDGGAWRG